MCCTVQGDTNSDMLWYQNSFLLDATERRSMDRNGDKYCLRIRNFQVSDFGNYSCVADNALGRTKKYIEVSGSPGPAIFLSAPYSGFLDLYNLTWTIESIPPLEEIRLLYRRLMVSAKFMGYLVGLMPSIDFNRLFTEFWPISCRPDHLSADCR